MFEAIGCRNITSFERNVSDISPKIVHTAREYHRKNGSGCKVLDKPIIVCKQMVEVKEREFKLFFANKTNVNMSSYHIDKKTQLPILYLKDQKSALWEKFSAIYPDGIKRTLFMTHLQNGYHDDLGGLCLIYNDYAYQLFEDLIKLVSNKIMDKKMKNELTTQLEMLHHHLKKDYENELFVHNNGTTKHVDCINHCLLYAFGKCAEQYYSRCAACDQLFEIFATLSHALGHSHQTLFSEYQEKLTCYLAHQTRKRYLNAQFNVALDDLDNHEAVIVVDYKMCILPATARETKSEFFGKRDWTLHTTLIFQKKDNEKMEVQAYDHCWYEVEVRGWIFLEFGEAKTTVDSYHEMITHAIKRYVRIGCELTSGQDIENAIKELSGTSVAQIESDWNKNNNMILEKSWYTKSIEHDKTHNSPNPTSDQIGVDIEFLLKPGWTLKENQKMGNKGGEKHISKKVIQYLQAYFHAVHEKELDAEDISEVKTIKEWIGRYSASSKKEMSEKALEQSVIEESSFVHKRKDTENTIQNRAKKR
ncbi:hypothetical protein RclHR1_07960014 [Rhizophagus clarus]|nr:hypothetical protein RclHR1_07960014 [Rhizophagus clarus]